MTTRVLTGITPSGTPHLGNYVGAIRPAIAASRAPGIESFFFLADLHSLIKAQEPERTQRSTLEIAASWLACGLDPDKVWFYRQSDIPETTELMWFLTVVAGKGILNRAHAYKAAVDKNREEQLDDDAGITAGLFMYPVLMAADILIFNAHYEPIMFTLPDEQYGSKWQLIVDTHNPNGPELSYEAGFAITAQARSFLLLKSSDCPAVRREDS